MIVKILMALFLVCGAAAPGFGEISRFADNEMRAAVVKDRLSNVEATLKDDGEAVRRHSAAIIEAFKDAEDWAPVVEDYYSLKTDLIARASALKTQLDAAIARNSPEYAETSARALEKIFKQENVLRSNYEFYTRLPKLAAGPQRQAALASMRLLAQTGDYTVSLAFFLSKTPHRPPFAPLTPGVMAIRHR